MQTNVGSDPLKEKFKMWLWNHPTF